MILQNSSQRKETSAPGIDKLSLFTHYFLATCQATRMEMRRKQVCMCVLPADWPFKIFLSAFILMFFFLHFFSCLSWIEGSAWVVEFSQGQQWSEIQLMMQGLIKFVFNKRISAKQKTFCFRSIFFISTCYTTLRHQKYRIAI